MPRTIFYAWQSDTDAQVNHFFIADALKGAIAHLNAALRLEGSASQYVYDRDTHGEPGMPPVADTILRKIDEATIFVADLTLVATLKPKGKGIPNANVGIELGYAAKSLGFERIICVFNAHYGNAERLPFDLVHRRFPVQYTLSPEANAEERGTQLQDLTGRLAKELRAITNSVEFPAVLPDPLPSCAYAPPSEGSFVAADRIAHARARDSEGRESENVFWHRSPSAWLRVIPAKSKQLGRQTVRNLATAAQPSLRAFGDSHRNEVFPNTWGAVAIGYEEELADIAMQITQVFLTGEIWGINRALVEPELTKPIRTIRVPWPQTMIGFCSTLAHFLHFAHTSLALELPVTVVAGLEMLSGVPFVMEKTKWFSNPPKEERFFESTIISIVQVERWDAAPEEILKPFFRQIFDACALDYDEWLQHK